MKRDPLSPEEVAMIRKTRAAPRITQWDYLHLETLRRGLIRTCRAAPVADGPVLDLYCGSQPYRQSLPWPVVVGLDMDLHFGSADVVGSLPLPFRDGSFAAVLCTQALYLVDDPVLAIDEIWRVLAPGGYAIVTVPHIFRREMASERRYGAGDLQALFSGWAEARVETAGGAGTGAAFVGGSFARSALRRLRAGEYALEAIAVLLNPAGLMMDFVLRPLSRRFPASLILTARKRDG